jgi:hypothetical protein
LEIALQNLYNFASLKEFNVERPVFWFSKVVYERRITNQAIKSLFDIQLAVLLNKLPADKLDEFIRFPWSSQLGFIRAIPEQDLNTATATITDVGFIGSFPKIIFQAMCRYQQACCWSHCCLCISSDKNTKSYTYFTSPMEILFRDVGWWEHRTSQK